MTTNDAKGIINAIDELNNTITKLSDMLTNISDQQNSLRAELQAYNEAQIAMMMRMNGNLEEIYFILSRSTKL